MTPLGWFFIILMAVATLISVSIAWHASPPVDLRGIGARLARPLRRVPLAQKHTGHHRAGAAPVLPLPAAQVIAQEDVMHGLNAAFQPQPHDDRYDWMALPSPRGQHPYLTAEEWQAIMQAGRPVEPAPTPDRPPWMITTNALEAVPAQTDAETLAMYHAPAFGVDRCEADVLAAGRALPAATGAEVAW